ncbi:MAG: hypothetical protein EP346_12640 [Bacteroidetes bacterium]|nr:MAG: hypothetical protein EP346_12640 [Bacteroidota bacterium]
MRSLFILFLVLLSWVASSQTQDSTASERGGPIEKSWLTLRTHPLRFIYGLNAGVDVRLSDRVLIGFTFQNYNRDFMSPEFAPLDVKLTDAKGYLWDVQLYIETHTVAFHGPRFALKAVTFADWEYTDEDAVTYVIWRDQQNWYLTYTLGLRRIESGMNVMVYATAGAVVYRAFETNSLKDPPNTSQSGLFEHVYPHVLIGVSLGYSF